MTASATESALSACSVVKYDVMLHGVFKRAVREPGWEWRCRRCG